MGWALMIMSQEFMDRALISQNLTGWDLISQYLTVSVGTLRIGTTGWDLMSRDLMGLYLISRDLAGWDLISQYLISRDLTDRDHGLGPYQSVPYGLGPYESGPYGSDPYQ
jgi:hypothetical protein